MPGIDKFAKVVLHFEDFTDSAIEQNTISNIVDTTIISGGKFDNFAAFNCVTGSIKIPYSPDLVIRDRDFAIDFWVKDFPQGYDYKGFAFLKSAGLYFGMDSNGSHAPTLKFSIGAFDGSYYFDTGVSWPLFTNYVPWTEDHQFYSYDWIFNTAKLNHFEINGSGQEVELFINGISQGLKTLDYAYNNYAITNWDNYPAGKIDTSDLYIAGETWEESTSTVKIDEFRYTIGTRRHTANFTPSTEPYSGDPKLVKLILSMNGADESQAFIDSSAAPHTVVAAGNVKQDTGRYQLGTASGQFDASSDYLSITDTTNWEIFNNPFTIHFWFRPVNITGNQTIFKQYRGSSTYMLCTYNHDTGLITFEVKIWNKKRIYMQVTADLPLNEFSHIAIVGS